ncbi:unnamed protein product [Rotaria sordida]|uniref:Uncharacterized protein n=1 Tax=Rotaria sordida TaxID=392033 RepID=A0A815C613_9BILA|nr:unnamed protein product [Rotaria sordida]CAF1558493.1 unnamed protein product [Rotaria sordida]
MSSKTPDIIILNNKPSSSMTEEFSKLMITLPIHQQKIQLKLDSHCNEDADIIQNCLALHIGLSLVEFVLQECPQCAYWLKDHFLPSNHILFTTEVNPSNSQIDEMFNITQLIRQATKAPTHLQASYSIMIGIKYLHEFAHFIYAKYGRLYLRNTFGIPLQESASTPIGILRGESGNRFEDQMLGFVLSHTGHLNIPMNLNHVKTLSNLRLTVTLQ